METLRNNLPLTTEQIRQITGILKASPILDNSCREILFENAAPVTEIATPGCKNRKTCWFDIETTGLSPKVSNVYLIGAADLRDGAAVLTQWFADDYVSEKTLLSAFAEYLSGFDTVIHFNGSTFDIPYLEKKYADHGLPSPFLKADSIDLYRRIAANKPLFHTPNHKLVTMEKLVGFDRGQDFSGKECIQLYTDYMQHKFAHRDEEAGKLRTAMLSHNTDDLIGTMLGTNLLLYTDRISGRTELSVTEETAVFTDVLPDEMRYPFTTACERSGYRLEIDGDTLTLYVPLIRGTMVHFFPDYKNYYYLPDEDMAVHKSVGTYVDKAHRRPATAADCYIKKTGTFLPVPKHFDPAGRPLFSPSAPRGQQQYIEAADVTDAGKLLQAYL